jgi:hypothetical protein
MYWDKNDTEISRILPGIREFQEATGESVCELLETVRDPALQSRILKNAMGANVPFSNEQVIEMIENSVPSKDTDLFFVHYAPRLSSSQVMDLIDFVSAAPFQKVLQTHSRSGSNLTWEECYALYEEGQEDLNEQQIEHLVSFGEPDDVFDVAVSWNDDDLRSLFLDKALDYGIRFNVEQIKELLSCVNGQFAKRLLKSYSKKLTQNQFEELEGLADIALFDDLCGELKWYIRLRIEQEGLCISERDVKHVREIFKADQAMRKKQNSLLFGGFFALLLGHKAKKAVTRGETCLYFQGSICSVAADTTAISDKCTSGQYMNCYFFQTRKSRKRN